MPLRGRKPKPVALKLIQGNPGKRKLPATRPAPKGEEIPVPVSVARNPRVRAFWDHYVETTAPGHLRPVDGPLLARLCRALATAAEAEEQMDATGLVVTAPDFGARRLPAGSGSSRLRVGSLRESGRCRDGGHPGAGGRGTGSGTGPSTAEP